MPNDCTFCRIVGHDDPAFPVYEDATTMAFLDLNAVAIGHTLVIPRTHAPRLTDLDGPDTAALFTTVREVAGAIERALDPDGYNLLHATGSAAGQEIPHAHVHVVPRYESDGISFSMTHHRVSDKEGQRVSTRIAEEM